MEVRFGEAVPKGFLPVYSVDTEEEARRLIVGCCSLGLDGKSYYARELMQEQTIDNLMEFSERLARVDAWMKARDEHVKEKKRR